MAFLSDSFIIANTLENARRLLSEKGILIKSVKVTAPPKQRSEDFDENFRVVNYKSISENEVELIVCRPLVSERVL